MTNLYQTLCSDSFLLSVIKSYEHRLSFRYKKSSAQQLFLQDNKRALAQEIAKQMKDKSFVFKPATQTRLCISSRRKKLYVFSTKDLIVLKALLALLMPTFKQDACLNLYSYIPGRDNSMAICRLKKFISSHQSDKKIDLYFYKTDLSKFFDSIAVGIKSVLWDKLYQLVSKANYYKEIDPFVWDLYQSSVKPYFYAIDGGIAQNIKGIPYGSPISGLLSNLYLSDIDKEYGSLKDIFYARYCDDILIASSSPYRLNYYEKRLKKKINNLGCRINPQKEKRVYFNRAGRPSNLDNSYKGSSILPYLGYRITANGDSLPSKRRTRRLHKIALSMLQTKVQQYPHLPVEKQGLLLCDYLSTQLLSLNQEVRLRFVIEHILFRSNTALLKQLDLRLAQTVIEKLSGIKGKRAFRFISYQCIRKKWRLPSLLYLSHKAYKQLKRHGRQ